jgi:hypothetical protein
VEPGTHDRVFGAGPELDHFVSRLQLNVALRHQQEFGARDRPRGHITTLTLTKIF